MSEARDENFQTTAIVCGAVMVVGMLIGGLVGCQRQKLDACKAVMSSNSEQAKLLAQSPGGVCHLQ